MQLEMEFPRKRIDNLDLGNAENQVDLVKLDVRNFGTFSDSRTAPIHRWFQYPAGFSYRAVEFAIKNYGIKPGNLVFDPFVGTGTTSIVAKGLGIESYGIEAHKFVQKVAAVKTKWDYPAGKLQKEALKLFDKLPAGAAAEHINLSEVPELVQKCFSVTNLKNLVFIREEVKKTPEPYRSLFSLALTCTLRLASAAATGWPYISPKSKIKEKDGVKVFQEQLSLMIRDIETTPIQYRKTKTHILLGDARNSELQESMFDLSFTSPPYLNNYDYADRTRLETYFHQIAENWADITNKVRNKLIMSATTQISRTKYVVEKIVSEELISLDVRIAKEIQDKVNLLKRSVLSIQVKRATIFLWVNILTISRVW